MIKKPMYFAHQLTEHTKLLHKVALVINDQILILKRATNAKSRPGCWDLPGGNSEWPVKVKHPTRDLYKLDVAREVWEETGIRVQPDDFNLKDMVYFSTFFEPKKEVYTIICGWKVTGLDESFLEYVTISREHTEFAWVRKNELKNYDFGSKKGQFIVEIIKESLKA